MKALMYAMDMSQKSAETFVEEDGQKKEALVLTFTNGSLQQLRELAPFLNVNDPADVVAKAIGLIQQLKNNANKQ